MSTEELLLRNKDKEVWLKSLSSPYHLVLNSSQPYVCIIFIADNNISAQTKNLISKEIVDKNCKYAVCAGYDCSAWEDEIDMAHLQRWNFDVPEHEHVMTTCHKDDAIQEVLYFGFNLTNFDHHEFQKYVILQLGHDDVLEKEIIEGVAKIHPK